MEAWENFEYAQQLLLAPLLADTRQKRLFVASNKCHERVFFDLVARVIKPTHFFEIGAHEASTAIRMAARLTDCQSIAFEGDPDIHALFSAKHATAGTPANFHYLQSAVSDQDGETVFWKQTAVEGVAVSAVIPNNSMRKKELDIQYREVRTPCLRLDTYAQKFGVMERSVLRIDVEGLCFEVLKGAEKTLDTCYGIYAEIEDYEIWKGQKTVFDIYPYLAAKGFVPVSRDVQSPGQYNVFWLRREDALKRQYRSRLAVYYNELIGICRESKPQK